MYEIPIYASITGLNDNHVVSQCKTRGRCKSCHRKHHTSLCSTETPPPSDHDNGGSTPSNGHDNEGSNQLVNTVNTSPVTNMGVPTTTSPATLSPTTIQHLSENRHKSTLLKTAISPIEHNGSITTAHILFDEGSHRSFITSSLARSVGLTIDHEEILSLSTFGGSIGTMRKVGVGTINLQTLDGESVSIEVIIVPEIAAPCKTLLQLKFMACPTLRD